MAENTHCIRVYSDRISKGKPRKRFDITPVIYIFVKTDTMKERIERILKEKSLSSNKLAEMLEVQPSGISHILSGRNKPSMDFITKLLTVFPDISPDWFILGKGDMYRTATNPTQPAVSVTAAPPVSISDASQPSAIRPTPQIAEQDLFSAAPATQSRQSSDRNFSDSTSGQSAKKAIRKVMIFFSDHTVESFDYCNNE